MGKQSVYEALKRAIRLRGFLHYGYEDQQFTILFASWDQFRPFDRFLKGIDTLNTKLCIYSELVDSSHEGVAVTVSDEVQHFTYWQSKLWMRERVTAFERLISELLFHGIGMLDYSYSSFRIDLGKAEATAFKIAYKWEPRRFLPDYASCHIIPNCDGSNELSLSFPAFE